ncbi:helix-turn-helix domain-containing protein [Planotetraspora kaengkrachanensis]|uniref:Transcriptional regulator n=1 Tax=Planotetraspora kaengkrachanensis TaxID=575193 RepID=A0A8J3M4C2_9ACTN|nr:helix-turn-helix transcriptional regulator [Planotetraspora kaengkrachanensis]GIG78985.1 transcriptional regulator [Planotetraspora kaengkrachanensis]
MDTTNALGAYLRARRDLVRPEDVGLIAGGRRRVPGLRREELAMLAGISSDYYLRLEQGRGRHPSAQILDALAGALRLDAAATAHLHQLARPRVRRSPRPRAERVPAGIAQLVDQFPMPAYVYGRYMDVLAANALARALSPNFRPGRNVLRQVFLDPGDRELYLDWERATAGVVGGLRAAAGADPEDPRLAALVGELSIRSDRFRTLWARAEVGHRRDGTSHLMHPKVGELHLRHEKLVIPGADGLQLIIYHTEPGTESAQALALLGSIAATEELEAAAGKDDAVRGTPRAPVSDPRDAGAAGSTS